MTTLLELTGALGITSILSIAAITSMSGAPGTSDDVRAQASLHAAVITALGADAVPPAADDHLAELLAEAEPGLEWTTVDSGDANVISVAAFPGSVGLAARSVSGSCFTARVGLDGTVVLDELTAVDSCSGRSASAVAQ